MEIVFWVFMDMGIFCKMPISIILTTALNNVVVIVWVVHNVTLT